MNPGLGTSKLATQEPLKQALTTRHTTGLGSAFASGEYSDMTISCGGTTFKVHKVIICSQSKVFKAMMNGAFKEGKSNHIDLPEEEVSVFEAVLDFKYTGEYTGRSCSIGGGLKFHGDIYSVADRYDIPALARLAGTNYWDYFSERYVGGRNIEFYIAFLESVPSVYEVAPHSATDMLRGNVIELFGVLSVDMADLEAGDGGIELQQVRERVMKEVPDFAVDIYNQVMKRYTRDYDRWVPVQDLPLQDIPVQGDLL